MRRPSRPLIAALLVLAAAGCHKPAPKTGTSVAAAPDPLAAKVGAETLHVSDVTRAAQAEGLVRKGEAVDPNSQLFRQTLEALIDQRLLAHEALRQHLDREDVVRRQLDAARDKILGDAVLERVVDKAVNAQAVQALYDEQKRNAKPGEDELQLRQIVVGSQAAAEAVKRQLAAGGDFAKLAAQRSSDGATRFTGGEVGWLPISALPVGYAAPLTAAKPGEVVAPFAAVGGWVVAQLEARRAQPGLTLEAARPQIVRFLTYDEIRTLLAKLRGQDKVFVLMGPAPPKPAPAAGARS